MGEERKGYLYGLAAYAMWGFFPLYFRLLAPATPLEILAHRIIWSVLFVSLLLAAMRNWRFLGRLVRRPGALAGIVLAGALIGVNWGTYIYGVNAGRVVETSLGYFITPLVVVLLGVTVLRERLRALQWAAIGVGAVAVAVLTRMLVGSHAGNRLVLIGVGLSAALFAVVQYLFTRADEWDAQLMLQWLIGSLNRTDWPTIRIYLVLLLALLPAVVWLARSARVAELGPDVAAGLGVGPQRSDLLLLLAVLLCAVATAAAGPIAFAAFLSGPIARSLNFGRSTLFGAGLVGATLVIAADYLGAYLVPDSNYPVGVVTGALGAPLLLWLLATGRASRRSA